MIAKQTVFLSADRSRAVVASDPDAKFLLCRAGLEIADKVAERYPGAVALLNAEAVKKPAPTLDEVVGGGNREEDLTLEQREEEEQQEEEQQEEEQQEEEQPKGQRKGNKKHPLGG